MLYRNVSLQLNDALGLIHTAPWTLYWHVLNSKRALCTWQLRGEMWVKGQLSSGPDIGKHVVALEVYLLDILLSAIWCDITILARSRCWRRRYGPLQVLSRVKTELSV